jgi:hydrogenase expression/formation protein HypD
MKYVDEFRDPQAVHRIADAIGDVCSRRWTLMEICGGQTHSILKSGLDELLPSNVNLIHGPGCPVCVTPVSVIDHAIDLSLRPGVVLCSFGDMLRVPGSSLDLLSAKARGGDVRVITSPLDAVRLAQGHPDREVVLFAVGFETTAPTTAMAAYQARQLGLLNFSLLVSHMLVPPAMETILSAPDNQVQGFLAAGHVCTVMGYRDYEPIASRFGVPIVVTGFEPIDILHGIWRCILLLESDVARVDNQYERYVRAEGNVRARAILSDVFAVTDRPWRGLGVIHRSGLTLAGDYEKFDAALRFGLQSEVTEAQGECIAGQVLTGVRKPHDCSAFGVRCNPLQPLGAPMVSTEGACAAYYRYRNYSSSGSAPTGKAP